MQYNEIKIKYHSKKEWFNLIPIGDVHLGHIGCELKKLKELVDWIANKENTYWLGMGDYIDAINYTDPRFDPKTVDISRAEMDKIIQIQIEKIIDIFEPIKDKCLGLHRGNHEETIRRHYIYDVVYEMAKEMGLQSNQILLDAAITRLKFNRLKARHSFDIFSTHGNVGGRKGGIKINRLEDLIGFFDADVYLIAHAHIKASEIKTQLYYDNHGNLKQKKKILAVTGAFLKGYEHNQTSYVEKWMYPPTDIGVVKIMFQPETGDIHISL